VTADELRNAREVRTSELVNFEMRWRGFVRASNALQRDPDVDLKAVLEETDYFSSTEQDQIIAIARKRLDEDEYRPEMRLERIVGTADYMLWIEGVVTRVNFDQLQKSDETARAFCLQHDRVMDWRPAPPMKAWQCEKTWRRSNPSKYDSAMPQFDDYAGEWPEVVRDLLRNVVPVDRLILGDLRVIDVASAWLRDAPAITRADRDSKRWYDTVAHRYVFDLDEMLDFVQQADLSITKRKLALVLRDELRCDSMALRDAAGVYKAMVVPGRALPRS
jgi:hypothetical protein